LNIFFRKNQNLPTLPEHSPTALMGDGNNGGGSSSSSNNNNVMVEYTISKRFRELKIFEKTLKKLNKSKISSLMPALQSSLNVLSSAKGMFNTNTTMNKDDIKDIEIRRRWIEIFLQCIVHTAVFRTAIVQHFLLPKRVSVYELQGRNGRGGSRNNDNGKSLGKNSSSGSSTNDNGKIRDEKGIVMNNKDDNTVWDDEVLAGDLPSGVSYQSNNNSMNDDLDVGLSARMRKDDLREGEEDEEEEDDQLEYDVVYMSTGEMFHNRRSDLIFESNGKSNIQDMDEGKIIGRIPPSGVSPVDGGLEGLAARMVILASDRIVSFL
jgi:hypothetical protein